MGSWCNMLCIYSCRESCHLEGSYTFKPWDKTCTLSHMHTSNSCVCDQYCSILLSSIHSNSKRATVSNIKRDKYAFLSPFRNEVSDQAKVYICACKYYSALYTCILGHKGTQRIGVFLPHCVGFCPSFVGGFST